MRLTAELVNEIRDTWDGETYQHVADKYGYSTTTIHKVLTFQVWVDSITDAQRTRITDIHRKRGRAHTPATLVDTLKARVEHLGVVDPDGIEATVDAVVLREAVRTGLTTSDAVRTLLNLEPRYTNPTPKQWRHIHRIS